MPPRKSAINAIEFFLIGFTEVGCRKVGLSKSRKTKQNIVSSIKIINGAPKKTSGAVDDEFMVEGEKSDPVISTRISADNVSEV
jgi:hypothetical protein